MSKSKTQTTEATPSPSPKTKTQTKAASLTSVAVAAAVAQAAVAQAAVAEAVVPTTKASSKKAGGSKTPTANTEQKAVPKKQKTDSKGTEAKSTEATKVKATTVKATTVKATKVKATKVKAAEAKNQDKALVDEVEEVDKNGKKYRYFRCFYEDKHLGRYKGQKPMQAANKAFSSLVRSNKAYVLGTPLEFRLVECTRGSAHKTGTYTGMRLKRDVSVKVQKKSKNADGTTNQDGGAVKVVEYWFNNKVTRVKAQVQALAQEPVQVAQVVQVVEQVQEVAQVQVPEKKAPVRKAVK